MKKKDIERKWYLVDATGVRLGRLASFIAKILQGKNSPKYSPNVDCGDYVIVMNSRKIDVNPKKPSRKLYWKHTGYIGGIKSVTLAEMLKNKPNDVIKKAIRGMIPKTKLGKVMLKKLFVYEDEEHKHEAQKPKLIEIK